MRTHVRLSQQPGSVGRADPDPGGRVGQFLRSAAGRSVGRIRLTTFAALRAAGAGRSGSPSDPTPADAAISGGTIFLKELLSLFFRAFAAGWQGCAKAYACGADAGQLVYPIATHTGQLVYPIAMCARQLCLPHRYVCAGQLVYPITMHAGQRVYQNTAPINRAATS